MYLRLPRTYVLGYYVPPFRGLCRDSRFGNRAHFLLEFSCLSLLIPVE
jgi:hypothetical protein